jgi:hypothetical protein
MGPAWFACLLAFLTVTWLALALIAIEAVSVL